MEERGSLRYSIWDPTGNITALVESAVAVGEQPAAAAALMERHPTVEQVGFVELEVLSCDGFNAVERFWFGV